MISNILIPTDYSEASFNALETAIVIAKINNACIQLLHVNDKALVIGPFSQRIINHARMPVLSVFRTPDN